MKRRAIVSDTSDPDQVRAAQALDSDQDEDLYSILTSARGRRWLTGLVFDVCHVMQRSYVPTGERDTAFNEGSRSVGLAVWEQIEARHPEFLTKMMEERYG